MILKFIATVANIIAVNRAERSTIRELNLLTDRDLDDIGISRSDIPAVAKQEADLKFSELFSNSAAITGLRNA